MGDPGRERGSYIHEGSTDDTLGVLVHDLQLVEVNIGWLLFIQRCKEGRKDTKVIYYLFLWGTCFPSFTDTFE